jgi:lytic cellulose monooxygenase (C1-hydroxylating)
MLTPRRRMIWESWNIPHFGPVMTYLANCNGDCKTFKGDAGNVWVKIDQMAYDKSKDPAWASILLTKQNATWTVPVPPNLAPGEYVLRHEILGLQAANTRMGAQFYP